jgi:hypothetical protein
MAVSLDVFNLTLSDLSDEIVIAQEKRVPLFDRLKSKGAINKAPVGGTYFEHVFVGQAPGTATAIYTGSEVADGTRNLITYKYSVESHRFIAPIFIPKIELERNSGKQGIIKLVDAYPKATMASIYRDLNYWILAANTTGAALKIFSAAQLDGQATLNSQYVGTKRLGVTTGLLSFAAPASQTATTQNVAKSTTYEHYNQYGDISSWAANGIETMTTVYQTGAEYTSMGDGADIGMADPDSYANLLTYSADTVRIVDTDKAVFGKNVGRTMFFNATIYRDTSLDRSLFTGAAADGVVYFLNTDDIELNYFTMPKIGKFAEWTPMQDVVAAQVEGSMNLVMKRFNSQGAVTGAATA